MVGNLPSLPRAPRRRVSPAVFPWGVPSQLGRSRPHAHTGQGRPRPHAVRPGRGAGEAELEPAGETSRVSSHVRPAVPGHFPFVGCAAPEADCDFESMPRPVSQGGEELAAPP